MFKTTKAKIDRISFHKISKVFYEFNLKPIELENYLNDYLIGQKDAKAIISTKICTHFHKIKNYLLKGSDHGTGFVKSNIFIIGPTGVGKTYMIKLIAQKIGIPFVKGDATKFSETGYVGGDIEDLIRDLYWEANGDLEKARFGIVFLDEIDKIASSGDPVGPDVSRTGVQRALLKPLEETEIEIKLPQESLTLFEQQESSEKLKKKKIILNTKYILFVVSGAFHGLEEIIKKRLKKQSLGFLSEIESKEEVDFNYLKFVVPEDLVNYGFEREFIGRFPVIAVFDPLTEDELYQILANPNGSIIINKKRDFKVYGIDLAFTNDALREIAKIAYKEGTGARALARVLEKILIPFERTLPSYSFKYLGVTDELIKDPIHFLNSMINSPKNNKWKQNYLKALEQEKERVFNYFQNRNSKEEKFKINKKRLNLIFTLYKKEDCELNQAIDEVIYLWKQIKNYEAAFERRKQIKIKFTDDAIDTILKEVIKKDYGVFSYCEKLMAKLEYPLNLLKDHLENETFHISSLAFKNPDEFIKQVLSVK
ncbi:MAG: ATPase [Thermodesulfobacteriota bacterium]|nr:MAG: ATPase [Thermodesulfobacteriota bacterium]